MLGRSRPFDFIRARWRPSDERLRLARVGRQHRDEAASLVRCAPVEHVHVGAHLWAFDGLRGPGERMEGVWHGDRLVGVLQHCRGVSWATRPGIAFEGAFPRLVARFIARQVRSSEVLFGREPVARAVLDQLRPRGIYPEELRRQELMVAPQLFSPVPRQTRRPFRLRGAHAEDLPWLLETHAAMCIEDLGVDQVARNPVGYERYFQSLIAAGQVFVGEEAGIPVFKAETPLESDEARLVEGVYTYPHARGRGHASRAMSELTIRAARDGRRSCLYVHRRNTGARALYARLGYRVVCDWLTVLLTGSSRRAQDLVEI